MSEVFVANRLFTKAKLCQIKIFVAVSVYPQQWHWCANVLTNFVGKQWIPLLLDLYDSLDHFWNIKCWNVNLPAVLKYQRSVRKCKEEKFTKEKTCLAQTYAEKSLNFDFFFW